LLHGVGGRVVAAQEGEQGEGDEEGDADLEVALAEHVDAVLGVDGEEQDGGEGAGEEAVGVACCGRRGFGWALGRKQIQVAGGGEGHQDEVVEAPGEGAGAEGGHDRLLGEVGAGEGDVDDVAAGMEAALDEEDAVVDVRGVADEGPGPCGDDEPEGAERERQGEDRAPEGGVGAHRSSIFAGRAPER
jgi:hypothetical protein